MLAAAWVLATLLGAFDTGEDASDGPGSAGDGGQARLTGRARPRPPGTDEDGEVVRVGKDETRIPSSVDLGDPVEARVYLASLLKMQKVPWKLVGDVLAATPGPFSEVITKRLLEGVVGNRRVAAINAVISSKDGTLVTGLLTTYDDTDLDGGVRSGVLGALVEMQAADRDAVSKALAERLGQNETQDRALLSAIALRGGAEASRVLVEAMGQREADARTPHVPHAKLADDPAAAAVYLQALNAETRAHVLEALVRAVAQPGAATFAQPLIDMGSRELPDGVARARLEALAEVGGDGAVRHLLETAKSEDPLADDAQRALGQLSSAGPKGRAALRRALTDVPATPPPAEASENASAEERRAASAARRQAREHALARASLLRALARLRDAEAAPQMAASLEDASTRVQRAALEGLQGLGPQAREQIPALVRAYGGSERDVFRRDVVRALGTIGGEDAVQALKSMRRAKDLPEEVRDEIDRALSRAARQ